MDVSAHDETPKGIVARLQMALSRAARALQLVSTANASKANVIENTTTGIVPNATVNFDNTSDGFTSTSGSTRARIVCTLSGNCSAVSTVTVSLYKGSAATPIGPTATVTISGIGDSFSTTLEWVDESGPYANQVFGITATASAGTITVPNKAASYIIQDQ